MCLRSDYKQILIKTKEALVHYSNVFGDDGEIDYFIDVMDYLISGKILFSTHVFCTLYEELLVMSTVYKNSEFLKVVSIFGEILEAGKGSICGV